MQLHVTERFLEGTDEKLPRVAETKTRLSVHTAGLEFAEASYLLPQETSAT
jgi:hypothetical protein